jgi:hypothetical protein
MPKRPPIPGSTPTSYSLQILATIDFPLRLNHWGCTNMRLGPFFLGSSTRNHGCYAAYIDYSAVESDFMCWCLQLKAQGERNNSHNSLMQNECVVSFERIFCPNLGLAYSTVQFVTSSINARLALTFEPHHKDRKIKTSMVEKSSMPWSFVMTTTVPSISK